MNRALVDEIVVKENAHVAVLEDAKKYTLSFFVERKATMRILVRDDITNQLLVRLNNSIYFKTGTYSYEVTSRTGGNLFFEMSALDGVITNIALEEIE